MLGPIPQKWFDENRERFDAETVVAQEETHKCFHDGNLKRMSSRRVECTACHAGWFDEGRWKIEDGKLVGVANPAQQ